MPEPIEQGWRQLVGGDQEAAEAIFRAHTDHPDRAAEAFEGLGYRELRRSNAREAEVYARESLELEPTPQRRLLLAMALGDRGKRRAAQAELEEILPALSGDEQPHARALLGEQKIRRGRWQEGTEDFVEALDAEANLDEPHTEAFSHLRVVLSDLTEALVAGHVPDKEAMRFINQLDYRAPKSHAEIETFLGRARRAVTSREALSTRGAGAWPILPPHVGRAARRTPQRSARPSRSSNGQARGRSQPKASSRETDASDGSSEGRIDANKKDLQKVIEHERSQNAGLLSDIEELNPPRWPSEAGYDSLDTVEPVSLDRGSVFDGASDIDTRDFRLTSGDLLTQIFLERCLRNLLAATQRGKTSGFVLRPESIPKMELNCRDGLFDEMRPLSDIYEDRPGFEHYHQLALATFLGECLVKTYDGTWAYETDPYDTRLRIGEARFDPFGLVRRWMDADDKDDVSLEQLSREAARASRESTQMTVSQEYIDPTSELTTDSLAATLAELWVEYRVRLEEVSFAEIAATIEVIENEDEAIIFAIGAQWVPAFACGPDHAGVSPEGRVGMAYLRGNGQFAPLASRKALARYLEATSAQLDQEAAQRAVEVLATCHRPRWEFAVDDEATRTLVEETGHDFAPPHIEQDSGRTTLSVEAATPDGPRTYRIVQDPDAIVSWHVDEQ